MTKSPSNTATAIGSSHRRTQEPLTLTRPTGALKLNQSTRDRVAVQLAPGTPVLPMADSDVEGMVEVQTGDSEVYTIFEADLADASTSPAQTDGEGDDSR